MYFCFMCLSMQEILSESEQESSCDSFVTECSDDWATVNRGNGNLEWKEETESGKRKREMVVTHSACAVSTKAVYIICLVLFFVLVVIFIFLDRIVEI